MRRPGGSPPPSVPISRGPKVIRTVGGGGGGGGGTSGKKGGGWGCAMVPATAVALTITAALSLTACRPPQRHGSTATAATRRTQTCGSPGWLLATREHQIPNHGKELAQ